MLKNAYLLAKIGADTAENERNVAEILPKIGNYPTAARVQTAAPEGPLRPMTSNRGTGYTPAAAQQAKVGTYVFLTPSYIHTICTMLTFYVLTYF